MPSRLSPLHSTTFSPTILMSSGMMRDLASGIQLLGPPQIGGKLWEEVKRAKCVVELNWKKFDRERPAEDIDFICQVIISCFTPSNEREERLLRAYGIMLRRALIERLFITDDGGVFEIEGMVPSGSLRTGWLDTALSISLLGSRSKTLT
ncbi:hypothetical protein Peur_067350 [Populus x canadensis]